MIPYSTKIYRIMHINNLPEILNDGYIYCYNRLTEMCKSYKTIAYESIMDRRASINVPSGPGGNLLDYIAFYFAPRSPMLYSIYKGNIDGCEKSQEDLIYIVSTAQIIHDSQIKFTFTDGHGIMHFTKYYDNLSDLDKIDWNLMEAKYWIDTPEDPDRKRRRQAEFLVYKEFPWDLVDHVAVLTEQMKDIAVSLISDFEYTTQVKIEPGWYF